MTIKLLLIIFFLHLSFTLPASFDFNPYNLDKKFYKEIKKYFRKIDKRKLVQAKESNPLNIVHEEFITYLLEDHASTMQNFENIKILLTQILIQKENKQPIMAHQHHELRRNYTEYINSLVKIFNLAKVILPSSTSVDDLLVTDDSFNEKTLWILAHSILVNDYLQLCDLAYYNSFTRLYLNSKESAYNIPVNHLNALNKYLNNSEELFYLKTIFLKIENVHQKGQHSLTAFGEVYDILKGLEYYNQLIHHDVYLSVSKPIPRFMLKIRDAFLKSVSNTGFVLSKVVGNFAGTTKIRQKGYLYGQARAKELLLSKLKPLDVLLDKNYNRLSNYLITSHFGHAAIWLGTKDQLIEMGMWDHPFIEPFQEEIAKGNVILESVRSGVRLNSLDNFLDVDELAVLRYNGFSKEPDLRERVYFNGLIQLNKSYDFNFDTFTTEVIICSELVFLSFDFIDWDYDYAFKRYIIDPDHIAKRVLNDSPDFSLPLYLTSFKENEMVTRNLDYLKLVLKK